MHTLYLASPDEARLVLQAAIGLPTAWTEQVHELPIDKFGRGGVCGLAAACRQPIVAASSGEPLLARFRDAFVAAGLGAMWSCPLVANGHLIGTLATYYLVPKIPSQAEVSRLKRITRELARVVKIARWHYDFAGHYAAYHDKLRASYFGLIQGLLLALEVRNFETVAHARRVVTYTLMLAERVGVEANFLQEIALGASLHDVGKIGLSDAILCKPGQLTKTEFELIKQHPVIGHNMLRHSMSQFPIALELVRHHHERFDGTGYPDQLANGAISLPARLLSVADAFDVMTTERPYQAARSLNEARTEILTYRGTQFCPKSVDAFLTFDLADLSAVRRGELDRWPFADLDRYHAV